LETLFFREETLRGKLEDIEADFDAFLDELVSILFEVNVLENRRLVEEYVKGTVSPRGKNFKGSV